nr:hypothetical protein [Tanacetum cinerariifolium]
MRTDDQILPHIRWVPIGKSNCYLDLDKSQSDPIYKIAVDILKHTNFFRAFAASSTIPSIYIQQFWATVQYDKEALQITPVNSNQAFTSPPSSDALINFVNELGYPKLVRNLSNVVTNDMFQPWRALTTIINMCLTGKTSGFERPRAPVLQILWGVVTRTHIDYAERIWEEFTQSIHTFIDDKRNLAQHTSRNKKATLIVIPSIRFTKIIIYHLQRKHKFHPRPESLLHLPNEEPVLGYLKHGFVSKKRKPISTLMSVDKSVAEDVPEKEPQVGDEEDDVQRSLEESMKSTYDVPRGPLPPVVIREPEFEKYQPLPKVPGNGKEKAGPDPGAQDEGQAGSNPDEQPKGQAAPDPGNAETSQPMPSHVVHAGLDREHMDLDVADVSPPPLSEQMDEGFTVTACPKVQDNLKLTVEKQVHQLKAKVTETTTTTTTTTLLPPPYRQQQSTAEAMMMKRIATSAEYQAWTTTDIRLRPSISLTPVDLQMGEDMAPDEQAQLSDAEDIESAHIPK